MASCSPSDPLPKHLASLKVVKKALAAAKRRAALVGRQNGVAAEVAETPSHRVICKRGLQKTPVTVDPASVSTTASSSATTNSAEKVTPDPKHLRVDPPAALPSPRVLFDGQQTPGNGGLDCKYDWFVLNNMVPFLLTGFMMLLLRRVVHDFAAKSLTVYSLTSNHVFCCRSMSNWKVGVMLVHNQCLLLSRRQLHLQPLPMFLWKARQCQLKPFSVV